jgi:ABC-type transport system substrate-binding protein
VRVRAQADTLRLLFWQAPTILNPHLVRGIPDYASARCCFEPLLTADDDGQLIPVLAAEVPSSENGGLPDERTVIYRLRPGIVWADGEPFTADDVVFTYQFITNPQTAATTGQLYQLVDRVEALDAFTVRVTFKEPTAGWYVPFVGRQGMIVPRHALEGDIGAGARSAPFNLRPFGTGPYVVDDFKPGDLVSYSANPYYRDAGRPFFRKLLLKGGGDPVTAARAVLQTGEYDFAPFLQVEAGVLEDLAASATTGQLLVAPGAGIDMGPSPSEGYPPGSLVPIRNGPPSSSTIPSATNGSPDVAISGADDPSSAPPRAGTQQPEGVPSRGESGADPPGMKSLLASASCTLHQTNRPVPRASVWHGRHSHRSLAI